MGLPFSGNFSHTAAKILADKREKLVRPVSRSTQPGDPPFRCADMVRIDTVATKFTIGHPVHLALNG